MIARPQKAINFSAPAQKKRVATRCLYYVMTVNNTIDNATRAIARSPRLFFLDRRLAGVM
jgi:hypothetical protein